MSKQYKIEDYIGKEFKRGIYVLGKDEEYIKLHPTSNMWKFRCFCGNEFFCQPGKIACDCKRSCGCLLDNGVYKHFTHRLSKNRFYNIWRAMNRRCYNSESKSYPRYGGRGIYICDEWHDSPTEFIKWAESTHPCKEGYSLDRIDNNGPYAPWNCRWATVKQQCQNRRTNTLVMIDGESKSIAEWCDIYENKYSTVIARIQNGWNPEEAIKTEVGKVGTNQFSNLHGNLVEKALTTPIKHPKSS